jgi:hypothetical protein
MVSNLNPSIMKITGTVAKYLDEVTKDGRLLRPYTNSPMIIQLIMDGSTPVLDPCEAPNALRWDTPGTNISGKAGIWELVVDTATNTILHFNFISGR